MSPAAERERAAIADWLSDKGSAAQSRMEAAEIYSREWLDARREMETWFDASAAVTNGDHHRRMAA